MFEWRDFCVFLREMRSHLLSPLAVVSLANVERLNILRGFVRHRLVLRNTLHDSSAAALTHSARGLPERRKARGGKRSREKHRFERLQREEKEKNKRERAPPRRSPRKAPRDALHDDADARDTRTSSARIPSRSFSLQVPPPLSRTPRPSRQFLPNTPLVPAPSVSGDGSWKMKSARPTSFQQRRETTGRAPGVGTRRSSRALESLRTMRDDCWRESSSAPRCRRPRATALYATFSRAAA